ncbi:GFA family protein [Hwanghaeella grinnelliae]|uniref:GFA family protein n=1 Tax=Hwanghaeella grinnelliae TaxID=2500179 RepID=A0A3S2VR90_9PROT|nr:GFA family protein [Hwanghaeella grinnelliae]RVU38505.1 GFA family protein [Hwanghaeella grinnelliae]
MSDDRGGEHKGSCLCGGVRYTITGPLGGVTACHCRQCQKQTGLHFASIGVAFDDFRWDSEATLRRYRSSEKAERGFCCTCGSVLFWRNVMHDEIWITAGTLDQPTGVRIKQNVHTEFAGDFYTLPETTD